MRGSQSCVEVWRCVVERLVLCYCCPSDAASHPRRLESSLFLFCFGGFQLSLTDWRAYRLDSTQKSCVLLVNYEGVKCSIRVLGGMLQLFNAKDMPCNLRPTQWMVRLFNAINNGINESKNKETVVRTSHVWLLVLVIHILFWFYSS
jgi:hypothetical protein